MMITVMVTHSSTSLTVSCVMDCITSSNTGITLNTRDTILFWCFEISKKVLKTRVIVAYKSPKIMRNGNKMKINESFSGFIETKKIAAAI